MLRVHQEVLLLYYIRFNIRIHRIIHVYTPAPFTHLLADSSPSPLIACILYGHHYSLINIIRVGIYNMYTFYTQAKHTSPISMNYIYTKDNIVIAFPTHVYVRGKVRYLKLIQIGR